MPYAQGHPLVVLDRLLRQQLLNLLDLEKLKGRLDNAVEEEGKVDEKDEAHHLQPLECLPAQTERDQPYEQGAAGIDGRASGGADRSCHRDAEEVEATER